MGMEKKYKELENNLNNSTELEIANNFMKGVVLSSLDLINFHEIDKS